MKIYTIMTCEFLEEYEDTGLPNYGCDKIVGFYTDLETAKSIVVNNTTDLWETVYDYACIEEVEEGINHPGQLIQWYKYNREIDKYEEIPQPEIDKRVCGRTIG